MLGWITKTALRRIIVTLLLVTVIPVTAVVVTLVFEYYLGNTAIFAFMALVLFITGCIGVYQSLTE